MKDFINTLPKPSPHWEYFKMIYNDFEKSLEYVHPIDKHFKVYSMRHYEFLLRACTEFESVCKVELNKVSSTIGNSHLNIRDYSALEGIYRRKLSSYDVGFRFDPIYFVRPLRAWSNGSSLVWYQSYNKVKHHRAGQFECASIENVLGAIAGLFVLLLAAELCPRGILTFGMNQTLLSNDEWPVIVRKEKGDHVYNWSSFDKK